ncbi:ATP-dependent rna helicase dhx8 [Pseudohyphozyma bogoriensis]|nr:ATP-dependent rna helicase dhx8 [Pseudohyphozyma bogoriensis]
MPSHVFFGAESPASTPKLTNGKAKRQGSPTPLSTSPKRAKRTVDFHESDDDDERLSATSGPSFAKNGKVVGADGVGKKKLLQADKARRRQEAERLLTGRQKLPVWAGQAEILKAVEENDTVVVLGETGSGKTTQIPHFLLKSQICGTLQPRICCTQPRRVAATSLADRVSKEVGCQLGQLVGYTVRFDDKSTPKTRLKYMTDGSLLAEMLGDRDLMRYECIVLDEAHERSLRTDMLMGFLKGIQDRRKELVRKWEEENKGKAKEGGEGEEKKPTLLKIVVMSATIDAKRFSEFFDNAPVLYVEGRQFKVKIYYAPEPIDDYCQGAVQTVFYLHTKEQPGDILVFLPGQEDIENVAHSIKSYFPDLAKSFKSKGDILICPLYAKLPPAEQAKAFLPAPPHTRKVILATNVAETSVTISGVKFVVDTGLAKEKEYHSNVGIDSLVTESISQSSAGQRSGRAGREFSGKCFRLYTERAYQDMNKNTKPEIQRVSLTFAILHLLAAGQENVWDFNFMDRPSKESISNALMTLHGLGAINQKGQINDFGRKMANFPLDPVYSRVLLASFEEGCPKDIIDLVSLISARDTLLINSAQTRDAANEARKKFVHRSGDHMMLLNILRAYEDVPKEERKNWCRDNYVQMKAMGQVLESRKQLVERCERLGLDCEASAGDTEEPVLRALVTGLFGNTALRQSDGSYRHAINRQIISIHPGSVLHNKSAPAIVYDELVLTTKTYARGCSRIELSWMREKAPTMFNARVKSAAAEKN